jgi:hypothetical protein
MLVSTPEEEMVLRLHDCAQQQRTPVPIHTCIGITPASPPPWLTPHPIPIAIQMRAITRIAATHGRCAGGARFVAAREGARGWGEACGRESRWRVVVCDRRGAERRRDTAAMAVMTTAFAIVVAAVFVETAAVHGGVAGKAQGDDGDERV